MAGPWSAGARDWAEVMEGWNGWGVPVYRHVLEHVAVTTGTRLLDVGCGAGRFARMAADRGAQVSGIDATPEFVEIACERILRGDFREGDMHELPWPDAAFDVVTGFNSFFLADDVPRALDEARRVLRDGGRFATTVFGRPDRLPVRAAFATVTGFPARSPASGPAFHEPGVLEDLLAAAGIRVDHATYVEADEEFADLDTVLRGYLSAPPFRRAIAAAGEDQVRTSLADALRPFARPDGTYVLPGELRCVVGTAV